MVFVCFMRNVGLLDRIFRFTLGTFLLLTGLTILDGAHGSIIGIIVAICSLLPFYMALTARCFVFNWFKIHSLNKKECATHGRPYQSEV
jgi:hypothetical protein